MNHISSPNAPVNPQKGHMEKLVALGAEPLASALVGIAEYNPIIEDFVERMAATSSENKERFRRKLMRFQDRDFARYGHEVHTLWIELMAVLEDLKSAVTEPREGVELVAEFFRADKNICENCDDSDGAIGRLFLVDATDLFISYAKKCDDKNWLCRLVLELDKNDDYCVRRCIVERAHEFLPEGIVQDIIE